MSQCIQFLTICYFYASLYMGINESIKKGFILHEQKCKKGLNITVSKRREEARQWETKLIHKNCL